MYFVFLNFEVNLEALNEFTFGISLGELFFGGSHNADRDQEADKSDKWVDKSNNLPHIVILSVATEPIDVFGNGCSDFNTIGVN